MLTACVPDLLEQQVQRTPHAVALIQGGQKLTYSQLNEQANRLANYLRARGVGPEVFVGLCMEQSLQAVVAVLGILKAGGAYVPLDPSFPQQRIEEIAADAKLAIAVTSARFDHRVPAGIETVCVDRDADLIAGMSSAAPVTGNTPDSAAYRSVYLGFHRETQRSRRDPSQHYEWPEFSDLCDPMRSAA